MPSARKPYETPESPYGDNRSPSGGFAAPADSGYDSPEYLPMKDEGRARSPKKMAPYQTPENKED